MIVKNEAPVIRRCLDSLRPLIDTWVIADTGSTDGTQDVIRQHLQHLPGELIERPWVNFAHNRSEALDYARGRADYTLVIDADETLEFDEGFRLPKLNADAYHIQVRYGGCSYLRKQLVRSALPWCYQGVLHEYIHYDAPHNEQLLTGLSTVPHPDGARARDPNTYRRDALTLENALIDEPNNTRYAFYLAQSYRDAGDLELALRHYRRRVEMGGWSEEIWFSLYQIAQIKERMEKPWPEVMQDYLAAYQFKSDRAEPLYWLGIHYQRRGEYNTAHLFFDRAMQIPYPSSDRLFIGHDLYEFLLPLEYAVSCYYVGDHSSAIEVNNRLLRKPSLHAPMIEQVTKNRRFSVDALCPPPGCQATEPGPVKLCIPFKDPDAAMDDLVESLLRQESVPFQAYFVDDGSSGDHSPRIPLNDPRFSLARLATPQGWEACIERFALQHCIPDDVVFALSVSERLADPKALEPVRAAFREPGCMLLYGQHRLPSGILGDAEPAPDETAFVHRNAALASRSPLAFRAGLLSATAGAAQTDSGGLVGKLMRTAGFQRTLFSDTVLTALTNESKPALNAAIGVNADGSKRGAAAVRTNFPPTLTALAVPPTISCLMVTYDRLALAKRSIECFANQTYPRKELLIVTNGDARFRNALERFVEQRELDNVRFLFADDGTLTLGRLRNMSLDGAQGEIICQWDDDDCSHPERLALQAEYMLKENARACFLTDHLQFLREERVVVWVDWTLGGRTRMDQLFPGTLMMFKDSRFRYPETGQYARRGEDSMFLYDLYNTIPVASLIGMGYLYLYTYHGRNTFSKEHHHHLSLYSRSAADMNANADTIRRALAHFPIEKPVMVGGCDGHAFIING